MPQQRISATVNLPHSREFAVSMSVFIGMTDFL